MAIRRAPRPDRFYVLNHEIIDAGLSAEALGVLVYVLSRPDDWTIYPSQLAKNFSCGKDKMTRILKEIRAVGYAHFTKVRDENGSFSTVDWVFSESKSPETENPDAGNQDAAETLVNTPEADNQDTGSPETENPAPGNPAPGNPHLLNKDNKPKKDLILKTEVSFDDFWQKYPLKQGKDKAQKSWIKLKPDKPLYNKIILNIQQRLQLGEWSLDRKGFIPHASTYLNQKRWTDEVIPRSENNACQKTNRPSAVEQVNAKLKQISDARERALQSSGHDIDENGVVISANDRAVRAQMD